MKSAPSFLLAGLAVLISGLPAAIAQPTPAQKTNALQTLDTRPPEGNDAGLRPLSPEEIAPNLNFYAMDPLYRPGAPLGWAAERIEEKLDRGLIALPVDGGKVYLGWRLLREDAAGVAFNVYRASAGGAGVKINTEPLRATTDFVDASASLSQANTWWVRPVVDGRELPESPRVTLDANAPVTGYRAIKLRDGLTSISMVGVGDLNGDGIYDFVVKHPGGGKDPGRITLSRDSYKFDGYDGRTGQHLWTIDLGWNVDMGIWWTPMVVRDLDGDNKAEVIVRSAPYAASLEEATAGARAGNALDSPEFIAVYNGENGQLVDQAPWIELGTVQDWGDNTGNRASRHLMAVAYLDGKTPSVLAARGTYGRMKIDAWTLRNRKLEKIWRWTNERAPFAYQGQGQHSIRVGDIDGDGMDEIINGSLAIDNDGRTLWTSGLGHGDRFYLTDINPARAGLEVAYVIEEPHPQLGLNVRDARSGDLLFGAREPNQDNSIDQLMVGDIDATYPGMELWANKGLKQLFYAANGDPIPGAVPTTGDLVWWDADLLREQITGGGPASSAPAAPIGRTIGKWKGDALTRNLQGATHQVADLLGDWREEIVTFTNGELRIHSTTLPATDRRVTLMQDPLYRNYVTERTMGYPHVPQLSTYLGVSP
jgi:rhamnogalacturonan endolyase